MYIRKLYFEMMISRSLSLDPRRLNVLVGSKMCGRAACSRLNCIDDDGRLNLMIPLYILIPNEDPLAPPTVIRLSLFSHTHSLHSAKNVKQILGWWRLLFAEKKVEMEMASKSTQQFRRRPKKASCHYQRRRPHRRRASSLSIIYIEERLG